jgi:hypothetical protein
MRTFLDKLPYMTKVCAVEFVILLLAGLLFLPSLWGWFFLGGAVSAFLQGWWYLLFDNTLNRVQYIPIGDGKYLYYITRDDGGKGTPWTFKSFMSMTAAPWLKGKGRTFRIPTGLTFQVGTARKMYITVGEDGLSKALGARPLDLPVEDIRSMKPARLVKSGTSDDI